MAIEKILRTQSIRIKKGHKLYPYCDKASLLSKNLYNVTNYHIKQVFSGLQKDTEDRYPNENKVIDGINRAIPFINEIKVNYANKRKQSELRKPSKTRKHISDPTIVEELDKDNPYINYSILDGYFKSINQIDYKNMPAHSNQHIMKLVFQDWKSFYKSLSDYKKNPSKYKGRPKPPRYAKKNGRKIIYFTNQTCKIKEDKYLRFPKTKEKLDIGKLGETDGRLKEVRIVPGPTYYTVEIIFEHEVSVKQLMDEPKRIFGIDLGVNNFATIVNNVGEKPIIVNGKMIKSINQYYNKARAHYYGVLRQGKNENQGNFTSKQLTRLDIKRKDKVKDFLHKASYNIVKEAVNLNIDTIIIGKNEGFKENVILRKDVKQTFIQIPYALFIKMLTYKANAKGINVIITEESYTSKASFLDDDFMPIFGKEEKTNYKFSGKRIKRGLYKSKDGTLINADVNGAANIIKKVVPNAFSKGNRGVVFTPLVLSVA